MYKGFQLIQNTTTIIRYKGCQSRPVRRNTKNPLIFNGFCILCKTQCKTNIPCKIEDQSKHFYIHAPVGHLSVYHSSAANFDFSGQYHLMVAFNCFGYSSSLIIVLLLFLMLLNSESMILPFSLKQYPPALAELCIHPFVPFIYDYQNYNMLLLILFYRDRIVKMAGQLNHFYI